jgi:hypothetical protein
MYPTKNLGAWSANPALAFRKFRNTVEEWICIFIFPFFLFLVAGVVGAEQC